VLETLPWVGFGLFCAASLWVGIRLLRLWTRTRQVAELLAAGALLLIGPLGFGGVVLSSALESYSLALANVVWALAAASVNAGSAACYGFSKRVFRPGEPRVRATVITLMLALAVCWFGELWTHRFDASRPSGPFTRASDWLRVGALAWGAFEALRYHARLRRRLALGLAEPLLVRRFLLWGLGLGGAALSCSIDATAKLFVDRALDYAALTLLDAAAGTLAAACLFLSFLPRRGRRSTPSPIVR
jgi:hypothetical protein